MPHILVVDDDGPVRITLGRLLRARGFTVQLAAGGTEARRALAEGHFDLVVSDVVMPGETGIELRRHLAERWPGLPVILISGFSDDGPAEFAARTPLTWFIPKPFAASLFVDLIQRALAPRNGDPRSAPRGRAEAERVDRPGERLGGD